MTRLASISNAIGTRLITTALITDSLSIRAFVSGWSSHKGVVFSSLSILLPVANSTSRESSQLFVEKQEKQNLIQLFAQRNLDSISDVILQAIQVENIVTAECHIIWKNIAS